MKRAEGLRQSGSKARRFCPGESKAARFKASLSEKGDCPFFCTMPAQPFTRPSHHSAFANFMQILRVFETPSLILFPSGIY